MTREQYLLQCLQEECAEVTLIASKINRFGLESYHPDDPEKRTNRSLLTKEVLDVMALIQIIGVNGLLEPMNPKQAAESMENKLQKLDKYMLISEELGHLQKDPQEQDLAPVEPIKTTD